jgi:hypothetical protein
VVIEADELLQQLTFDGTGRIEDLTVRAAKDHHPITFAGHSPDLGAFRLYGGTFVLPQGLVRPTTTFDLRDVDISDPSGGVPLAQLSLAGRVVLDANWKSWRSLIQSGTTLQSADHQIDLGIVDIEQSPDVPLEITLRGSFRCTCQYLPPDTTLRLHNTGLWLERPEQSGSPAADDSPNAEPRQSPPEVIERLTITGRGSVYVSCDLDAPVFAPKDGDLSLVGRPLGNVTNANGEVALDAMAGDMLCQGARDKALVLLRVGKVQDAELERIDIYSLTVGDVGRLALAARVTPWIPGPWEARKREQAMQFGTTDVALRAQRRADFWAQLSKVLKDQQASGSVQSNVRVAASRARRQTLGPGREQFWLSLYSLVGYGERILLPVLVWALGVVVAGLMFVALDGALLITDVLSAEFVKLLLRFVAGPFSILRIEGIRPPNLPGIWDTAIWSAAQILGTICLGFAILAVRKVTRAAQ